MENTDTQMTTAAAAREHTSIRLGDDISLVIFDMDGVIADTAEGHKIAWREYMGRFGKPFTDAEFEAIFGIGNKELCPILFPEKELSSEDINRIGDEKEALFRDLARGVVRAYPGFHEFLDLCDRRNVKMAVGSSACRANVDFILDEMGITGRFVCTVSSDDVEKAKPEPDIFLKAARLGGVESDNCLVLEDSRMGIAAAQAAGMKVAGMTTTHTAEELPPTDLQAENFLVLSGLIS
jgi:HAD superfamily hydrolase (TIGR01509 family)